MTTSRLATAAEHAEAQDWYDISLWVQPLGVMVDVVDPDSQFANQRIVMWHEIEESRVNVLCLAIDELVSSFPKAN